MHASEWKKLWHAVLDLQRGFEPGAVFIGGVAVFAHANESPQFATHVAFSHDADLLISVADYTDLKDIEQVTPNRRLKKCQFYKAGFEFDVYVEGQHGLAVPYDEAAAHSVIRSGVRVACLEHLLVLKMKAFADRRGSAKGDKDEDDVFTLLLLFSERGASPQPLARLEDDIADTLPSVVSSDAALRLAGGNKHHAATLRKAAALGRKHVHEALGEAQANPW